jgi:hypothetical protein
MSYSNLIRLGGLAAMVGGVLYAGVSLLVGRLAEELVYIGNIGYGFIVVSLPLGAMAAILALYGLHRERYGRAGLVLCLTAFLGLALATVALTLGVIATNPISAFPDSAWIFSWLLLLGLLVATLGLVLLGALSVAWQILPPWYGVTLMAGSPLGVLLTMVPSEALAGGSLIGRAFQALGGLLWVVVGYYIFRSAGGGRTERPARVR